MLPVDTEAAYMIVEIWGAHPMCLVEIWVKVSDLLSKKKKKTA